MSCVCVYVAVTVTVTVAGHILCDSQPLSAREAAVHGCLITVTVSPRSSIVTGRISSGLMLLVLLSVPFKRFLLLLLWSPSLVSLRPVVLT